MARRTLDEAETQIARMHSELSFARRSWHRYYERTRKLEAAIKKHARGECKCTGKGECLTRLVALTPVEPRPTLNQLRKGMRRG